MNVRNKKKPAVHRPVARQRATSNKGVSQGRTVPGVRTSQQTPGGVQQARHRRRSRRPAAKPKAIRAVNLPRMFLRAGRPDRTCTTKATHYYKEGRPGPTPSRLIGKTRLSELYALRAGSQGLARPTGHAIGKAAPVQGGGPPCSPSRTTLRVSTDSEIGNRGGSSQGILCLK